MNKLILFSLALVIFSCKKEITEKKERLEPKAKVTNSDYNKGN